MENLIKRDRLKFEESFQKGGRGSFAVKHFTNGNENLIKMPKNRWRH